MYVSLLLSLSLSLSFFLWLFVSSNLSCEDLSQNEYARHIHMLPCIAKATTPEHAYVCMRCHQIAPLRAFVIKIPTSTRTSTHPKMQILRCKNQTWSKRGWVLASFKSWVSTQAQITESVIFATEKHAFWVGACSGACCSFKRRNSFSFKRATSTRTSTHSKSAICSCKNHMFGEVGRALVGACSFDRHPSRGCPKRRRQAN
jgi:hypothetical protein